MPFLSGGICDGAGFSMGTHGVGVVVQFCTLVAVMRLLVRGALPARCSVVIALRCQNTTFSAQVGLFDRVDE